MDGWAKTTIGESADLITGFPFKSSDFVASGVRLVRGMNVKRGQLEWSPEQTKRWPTITAEFQHYELAFGDVVIGMDGSRVGENFAVISASDVPALLVQRVARLRGTPTLSQGYLRYLICNPRFTAYVKAVQTGTSIPHISKRQIEAYEVALPPLAEQCAIASILSAFDDKIELNRRTAATLEEMARAVFKSWFVDFDPVRAKAEGREPERMDAETAALFPDSFGDDGLPEGWVRSVGADLFEVTKGRSYKKSELQPSDTALVTLKSFNRHGGYARRGLKPYTGDYKPRQVVTPGDIVMACTDMTQAAEVVGRPAIVEPSEFATMVASLDVLVLRPAHSWVANEWMYWLLNDPMTHEHMRSYANGSTVLHLSKDAVPSLQCHIPPVQIVRAFSTLIGPMMRWIQRSGTENVSLAAVRDALLPRLLSGDLRVGDAEKIAQGAL